jgi:L-ascorbate metabolism protein UlaG (beta-lactamase superfamily)
MPSTMVTAAAPEVFPATGPEPGWLSSGLRGSITWTGCAGFVLELEGTRLCFDPYASNPGLLRMLLQPARPDAALVSRTFGEVDAVFVGHTHFDHAMDVAPLAKANPGCTVHGSRTTVEICRRQHVPDDQLQVVSDGFRTTVGPFTVEAVASRHGIVPIASRIDVIELQGSGMPRTTFRWPRGDVFAYRVEFAGRSIHLQTSAGIEDAPLARQQPVDVLVACLAARQGTPHYLERLGAQLQPKVLIPCHHDNFTRPLSDPPRPVPQLDWPEFLADADRLHAQHGTRLVRLPRGTPVPF